MEGGLLDFSFSQIYPENSALNIFTFLVVPPFCGGMGVYTENSTSLFSFFADEAKFHGGL
jgi:hypothetical protein